MLDVPSLVPHLFCVQASGSLFEEYYPDRGGVVQQNDIIRLCEGGWLEAAQLDNLLKYLPIDWAPC
jgi:hypothetical protein